ncbi:MAG: hypothetical protein Q7K71_07355 [Candidatus Omnitrophota bacterium]|nr:hypothetical protein [Candidatus Omnitrophota bacterium]
MNKIVVVTVCAVFLTVGRVWAQEAKLMANNVQSNEAAVLDPSDNAGDETVANDEGYGTDDEEYYGSEEDMVTPPMNAQTNADQENTDEVNDDQAIDQGGVDQDNEDQANAENK